MKLTFSEAAVERLQKFISKDTKIVLDFDDGVGPFSDAATCTLDASFNLDFVREDQLSSEFNATIDSNLGKVYVKRYSEDQMNPNMVFELNPKNLTYTLKGDSGVLDENVQVINLQDKK